MSTPANAIAVAKVLTEIDADPGTISNRSQQDSLLKRLTSKYKFRYYSSTYGHTCHDEKSLRSVLVAIMRHHGKDGEDIRPGKTPVDELFERGSEMLWDDYVEAITEAAKDVELEEDSDSEESEEESDIDQELLDFIEAQTDSDNDYAPVMAGRTRGANKRRRLNDTVSADTRQDAKTSYIDSWIEGCSSESLSSHSSVPEPDGHDSSCGSSSSDTSSIVVTRVQTRKRSTTMHLETNQSDAVLSASIKPRQSTSFAIVEGVEAHKTPKVLKRTEAIAKAKHRHCDGDAMVESRQSGRHVVERDGLLSIKLLAIAAIAALL